MMNKTASSLLASGFLFLISPLAQADSILVNDNFTNSTGSNTSTINNTESVGVGTHSQINGGTTALSVVTPSFFSSSKALQVTNGSAIIDYRAFDGAATLTLNSLAIGETLSLSFNVGYNADPTASLSFGFVNTTSANSVLYVSEALTASTSRYRYRTGSALMGAGSGAAVDATGWTEADTATATSYLLELEVTKLTGGGFQLEYFRDSSSINSLTVLSSDTWVTTMGGVDITGIAFRNESANSASLFIDNIQVSVVPEPSTYAMLLGGLGLLAFLRHRAKANR